MKMNRSILLGLLATTIALPIAASTAAAQNVSYTGKLQVGLGDADNGPGFARPVPLCAGGGPLVNTGPGGTSLGTLLFNGKGQAQPGVGGTLTFNAVGADLGGAQQKTADKCRETQTPFVPAFLRSLTRSASAHFPGRKGPHSSMIMNAPVPSTPTATYMLSMNGGNTQVAPSVTWTTRATPAASVMTFMGPALSEAFPGFISNGGIDRIQPGPNRFGGGLPYSGFGAVQLGVQSATANTATIYGVSNYMNGRVQTGPHFIGTGAKGVDATGAFTSVVYPASATNTLGLFVVRQTLTFAARTPGGSTQQQHGAIRTLAGGNTMTPDPSCPLGCAPIVSPVAVDGAYYAWTTGSVTHTNREGEFTTIRRAAGYDIAVASSTRIADETRRIQLVTPWSAAVRRLGPFSLPLPVLSHGGIAVLTLNVTPEGVSNDIDGDLVLDAVDNCLTTPNGPNEMSNQVDTDQDGYGNACDADYNDDGTTSTLDFAYFLNAFTGAIPDLQTDHNGDCETTTLDFPLYLEAWVGAVSLGPSGLACGGTVPCLP